MANDIKPFATGPGANVTPQGEWDGLPARQSGFQAGKASSAQVNKALRQASFIAAALAQYTADKSGQDVLDDGDIASFITKMSAAFGKDFQPLGANLTALASLVGANNKLPYFTGTGAMANTDLTAAGRELISKADVAGILTYLGLGDVQASLKYGTAIIGELVSWPREQMPHEIWPDCGMEFLPYMAQAFDAVKFPLLAQLHPTHILPADMRAAFPRGVDNRRGIDMNRGLMTEQGDATRNITGEIWTSAVNFQFLGENLQSSGVFELLKEFSVGAIADGPGDTCPTRLKFDASRVVPTASEFRPRNVAWQFIVRAK